MDVTWNKAVVVPEVKFAVAAWDAVINELPTPTTVMVEPSIVATEVSELV